MILARACLVFVILMPIFGCAPRVKVTKNPSDHDTGIRYYRPKPYLLVTPADMIKTYMSDEGEPLTETTETSDEAVQIELQYLPDFCEEYAIDIRPGLGSANVTIGLDQGWNLTSINPILDSQFDENLTALGQVVSSVAGLASAKARVSTLMKTSDEGVHRKFVVRATNVPLGYYESVIDRDEFGKKRGLLGWRYVGFMPYATYPEIAISGSGDCNIYGLVFEQGVMVFKLLECCTGPKLDRCHVATGEFQADGYDKTECDSPNFETHECAESIVPYESSSTNEFNQ